MIDRFRWLWDTLGGPECKFIGTLLKQCLSPRIAITIIQTGLVPHPVFWWDGTLIKAPARPGIFRPYNQKILALKHTGCGTRPACQVQEQSVSGDARDNGHRSGFRGNCSFFRIPLSCVLLALCRLCRACDPYVEPDAAARCKYKEQRLSEVAGRTFPVRSLLRYPGFCSESRCIVSIFISARSAGTSIESLQFRLAPVHELCPRAIAE